MRLLTETELYEIIEREVKLVRENYKKLYRNIIVIKGDERLNIIDQKIIDDSIVIKVK